MSINLRMIIASSLLFWITLAGQMRGGDSAEASRSSIPMPTLGGMQYWADELFFHKWRIQRNVFTGHYRLLDEKDRRHAWGTYDQCRAVLEQIKKEQNLPPMQGKAVIVLHGLGSTRQWMNSLCKYLEENGYEVYNVSYPSTQYEIGEHARSLEHIINNLEGIEELNFVAYSMGNIVIRRYLDELRRQNPLKNPAAASSNAYRGRRPAFHRMVMLAPPNHEAQLATSLADNPLFKGVAGEVGQQLGREFKELENKLATPDFDFGIIAGGKNQAKGYNPLLPGDNDSVITVESTKLDGARDFIVVPAIHPLIMRNDKVQEYTLRFLQEGFFVSEAERQPLGKK